MSEPKKVIDIEKSSLLSLKAELLRLKCQTKELKTVEQHKPRKAEKIKKDSKTEAVNYVEVDDSSELERSKRMLEVKSKYYDRMTKSKVNSSLVLFKDKAEKESRYDESSDYIEFTDYFGRTRKVEKSEYEKIKEHTDVIVTKKPSEEEPENTEFLRQKEEWRKQEELNKERNDVYYQDILFDEARLHGTAWYKFSIDHEERKIQQENLIKMREKTEQAQCQRAEIKKHRDDIIQNRIKLAKERMRLKLGLPIEQTENDYKISEDNSRDDDGREANETTLKEVDEKELERERERKRHVRPWDEAKLHGYGQKNSSDTQDDDEWTPKKEKLIMTQDEWIDKQRTKRVNEFAPSYDQPSTSRQCNPASIEQSVSANLKYIRSKFDKNS